MSGLGLIERGRAKFGVDRGSEKKEDSRLQVPEARLFVCCSQSAPAAPCASFALTLESSPTPSPPQ